MLTTMSSCYKIYSSSIGKKIIMAVTGLLFFLFLLGHLAGNLLLYISKETFNKYADALTSTSLIYIVELGLLAIILLHIWVAIKLSIENKKARPASYKVRKTAGESTIMSRYMLHSGVVILIFIVLHVVSFKYGDWDNKLITSSNTLYDHVVELFSLELYSAYYVISMLLLGFHLHHAVKSSMITLGIARKSTIKTITQISAVLSVIIAAGFSSFPIYFYIQSWL